MWNLSQLNLSSGSGSFPLSANWSSLAAERRSPIPEDPGGIGPKQSPLMIAVYSVAYAAVFLLGLAGNTLVIWIVYGNPKMHDVTNFLIVNLAVADILVCVFCIPITLFTNLYAGWMFGAFMCKAAPFLQGVSVSASVNTLMAIAVDRYLAICHVLKFRLTSSKARIVIFLIWLFAASLMSPWAIYYRQEYISFSYTHPPQPICRQVWPDENMERIFFLIAIFLFCYTIPLVSITVCYALIGYRVCNRQAFVSTCRLSSETLNKSKVKVVKMLVVVVVIFACSWLPLYAVNLRLLFGGGLDDDSMEFSILVRIIIPIVQWCGSANSCVNPIVYCLFSRKFRDGFRGMIMFCRVGRGRRRLRRRPVDGRGSTVGNSCTYSDPEHQLRIRRGLRASMQASVGLMEAPNAYENIFQNTSV